MVMCSKKPSAWQRTVWRSFFSSLAKNPRPLLRKWQSGDRHERRQRYDNESDDAKQCNRAHGPKGISIRLLFAIAGTIKFDRPGTVKRATRDLLERLLHDEKRGN